MVKKNKKNNAPKKKDDKNPPAPVKKTRPPRGHRQKGAGSTKVGKGTIVISGIEMKEWQRTPKQLIHEWTNRSKRPKPYWSRANGKPAQPGGSGSNRAWLTLPDPKKPEKSLKFLTEQGFSSMLEAQHAVSLLALKHLGDKIPHERKLPEPYRTMWLQLVGREDKTPKDDGGTLNKKGKKKPAWKIKLEEEEAKKEAEKQALEEASIKKKKTRKGPSSSEDNNNNKSNNNDNNNNNNSINNIGEKQQWNCSSCGMNNYADRAKCRRCGNAGGEERSQVNLKSKKRTVIDASATVKVSSSLKFVSKKEREQHHIKKQEERSKKKNLREQKERSNPDAPVFMNEKNRKYVENILKNGSITNIISSSMESLNVTTNENSNEATTVVDNNKIKKKLIKLGFLENDISKAFKNSCETFDDTLDWLCLNVDENNLPQQFAAKGKQLDVVHMGKNNKFKNQKKNNIETFNGTMQEEFLYKYGFNIEDIKTYLQRNNNDHLKALIELYNDNIVQVTNIVENPEDAEGDEEDMELLEEEAMVLESMFDTSFEIKRNTVSDTMEKVLSIELNDLEKSKNTKGLLEMYLPTGFRYPTNSPIILLSSSSWSSEQALQIQNSLARDIVKPLKGELVMYECSLWAQSDELDNNLKAATTAGKNSTSTFKQTVTETKNNISRETNVSKKKKINQRNNRNNTKRNHHHHQQMSKSEMEKLSKQLLSEINEKKQNNSKYKDMQRIRSRLPAHKQANEVVSSVMKNQVVLISGETGCGKTTQIPQFIMDDYINKGNGGRLNIICTQPRRLAAIGVAERVAQEQCCPLGDTIGYQIRMDSKRSKKTRLTFVTTGILLRRLHGDRDLKGVTHIIVDEVHERDVDTDFLLAIMREVLKTRKDLKLILMSATMDANLFVKYFGGGCPVIKIPGFVHPIKEYYLEDILQYFSSEEYNNNMSLKKQEEILAMNDNTYSNDGSSSMMNKNSKNSNKVRSKCDYDLLAKTILYADAIGLKTNDDGAILVFMSGTAEINKCMEAIKRLANYQGISNRLWILPLHGSLTSYDQSMVFRHPPKGKRKIVVSTNVAETSITIDDCVFVVDSGRMKEMQYDPFNRMSLLVETWVSKANARQRRGRAGRVRPGHCLKMYTRKMLNNSPAHQSPEMHRVPLERLCLMVRSLQLGKPKYFLGQVIEPPKTESIISAVRHLKGLRAFGDKAELTPLGHHLASMPVDAQIGKMLIYGAILRCTSQILTIAASMCTRSPFLKDDVANEAKKNFSGNLMSDHIVLLRAYDGWFDADNKRNYCKEHGLHYEGMRTIRDLRKQLGIALADAGFVERSSMKQIVLKHNDSEDESKHYNVLKAAICAGLYPNIVKVKLPQKRYQEVSGGAFEKDSKAKEIKFYTGSSNSNNTAGNNNSTNDKDKNNNKISTNNSTTNNRVFLHPASCMFTKGSRSYRVPWLVYYQKVQTSKVFLRDATMVPAYALLLFGGRIDVLHERGKIVVDKWMYFQAPARVGVLVRELRKSLDLLLTSKIENPSISISDSPIIDAIQVLLKANGL